MLKRLSTIFKPAPLKPPKRFDARLALNNRSIRKEARMGGQLFGHPGKGRVREFFCLDERTWVWHEVWTGGDGQEQHSSTIRYDIRADQIYKKQDNDSFWQELDLQETADFRQAVSAYRHSVLAKLYPERDWR